MVELALKTGFTAVDTANMPKHYDEELVGTGIERALESGAVERKNLFLQTKFTPDACEGQPEAKHPYDSTAPIRQQVFQSFNSSVQHLKTTSIDSLLLHAPYQDHTKNVEAFQAMSDLKAEGRVRFIGVSNFDLHQLKRLMKDSSEPPAFVQNRCRHKHDWDGEVRRFCAENGIIYQGFWLLTGNRHITTSNVTKNIAEARNAEPEQILLAYIRQHLGIVILDGTKQEQHMIQDLAAEAILLSDEEINLMQHIKLPVEERSGIQVTFVNTLEVYLSVFWKNVQSGQLVSQGEIQPQGSLKISTHDTHTFIVQEKMTSSGEYTLLNISVAALKFAQLQR